MGLISDLFQGIPLNAVLKERVELAEQKAALVEQENKQLQTQVDALRVLNGQLTKEIADLKAAQVREIEKPEVMYGCYYFGGDSSQLYCIKCYEERNKKHLASRVGSHALGIHKCTVCGNTVHH